MSPCMSYPVDVLRLTEPSVILSTVSAKIISSHHWRFIFEVTLETVSSTHPSLHFQSTFNLLSLIFQQSLTQRINEHLLAFKQKITHFLACMLRTHKRGHCSYLKNQRL